MKAIIGLVLALVLLVGCNVEVDTGDAKVEVEDGKVDVEAGDVNVKVEGNSVETKVDEDVVQGDRIFAPFSEWCNVGQTWTVDEKGVEYKAALEGVKTYKGEDWCKGHVTQKISSPVGDINVEVDYYISEDQSEYWVITDTMGQKTENHIVIE